MIIKLMEIALNDKKFREIAFSVIREKNFLKVKVTGWRASLLNKTFPIFTTEYYETGLYKGRKLPFFVFRAFLNSIFAGDLFKVRALDLNIECKMHYENGVLYVLFNPKV